MKIEETIRKLLALANSANENEAALAAEKASELALKYNIDLLAFQTQPSDYINNSVLDSSKKERWVSNIVQGVAKLNACKFYIQVFTDSTKYRIVGRPHNVHLTTLVSSYLVTTVKRLGTKAWQEYLATHPQLPSHKEYRKDFRKAFRLGASYRLYERLDEKYQSLNTTPPASLNTTALTVMNYFTQEADNINSFMEDIELTDTKARRLTIKSRSGYQAGINAANAISLEEQINGIHNSGLLGAPAR